MGAGNFERGGELATLLVQAIYIDASKLAPSIPDPSDIKRGIDIALTGDELVGGNLELGIKLETLTIQPLGCDPHVEVDASTLVATARPAGIAIVNLGAANAMVNLGADRRAANDGGMGTRNHAIRRLDLELGRAHNDNAYEFSMLLVQFDGLGLLTNHLGETPGSDLLRTVTTALMKDLSAHDLCCRLGRDEFLLILPAQGASACRDLGERMGQRWMPGASTREAAIVISMGAASSVGQTSTIAGLFGTADAALHAAKLDAIIERRGVAIVARAAEAAEPPQRTGFFAHRVRAAEGLLRGGMIDLIKVLRVVLQYATPSA